VTSNQPLGTSGDLRRRFLFHHVPLALASAGVLVLFMSLPLFDASKQPHADILSGTFPQERAGDHIEPTDHGGRHGGPMDHGGGDTSSLTPSRDQMRHRSFARQFTLATGYVALGLLALTLLIGPANLLLRKRNPISSYLSRDVGTWAVIGSVVHVIFGLQVHGRGQISDFLDYFVARDGSPRLNSFGLGNWTGLAALVIVVGLLAISSDAALRKLKARPWKRLQRLNYALFALVVAHAFFYGALLRVTSPFTLLLGVSVIAVFVGQAVGVCLWRRRYSRATATLG
jgi:sulfoxide reductase heme-binding subunit YedZ